MDIVFRVDSSAQMGSGHLMRCLTLANTLRGRGANICFVTRLHAGHLVHKIEDAGYYVHKLSTPPYKLSTLTGYNAWLGVPVEQDYKETLEALNGRRYDFLVVDHYGLDEHWERALRDNAKKIMVIDDLANRNHDCDVLLDQNYFSEEKKNRYVHYVSASTRLLLGPTFALLKSDYAQMREISTRSDGLVRRILVFLGNSDASNQTKSVLEALSRPELSHLVVDVVVGSNHPNPGALERQVADRGGVVFHYDLPSLAGLMMRSDFVIGAGGSTTWERMCLGKPSLVVCIAENQLEFTQQLAKDGYQALFLNDKMVSSEAWYQTILQLISNVSDVKKMGIQASQLVDGFGVERVASMLLDENLLNLKLRYANIRDEKCLFDWANDNLVRTQSFRQAVITEDEHKQWFNDKLLDPNSFIFIAENKDGLSVGQVRFQLDMHTKEALVAISIDAQMRGKGIALQLLDQAMKEALIAVPDLTFIAEIRTSNVASQRLFNNMGFTQIFSGSTNSVRLEFQRDKKNDATNLLKTYNNISGA